MRKLYLLVAGLLGAAAAMVPGVAASDSTSSASFTAVDYAWQANGGPGNSVTIAPGGTVGFSYPTGMSAHNADFGGAQPTVCTQTTGTSTGPVPPLPNPAAGPGWSGTCTFNTPGTYIFHCDVHPSMTGTIVVGSGGTGTTGTTSTTSPPPPGSTTTTQPGSSSAPPPAAGASVRRIQHGSRVRGSVKITSAGIGGTLVVDLLARKKRLGHFVRRNLPQGSVTFTVSVNAAARRALHRRHRLRLTVSIVVRSPSGSRSTLTRQVQLLS